MCHRGRAPLLARSTGAIGVRHRHSGAIGVGLPSVADVQVVLWSTWIRNSLKILVSVDEDDGEASGEFHRMNISRDVSSILIATLDDVTLKKCLLHVYATMINN